MGLGINYQLSMFGEFSIGPTPENISRLMPKINEMTTVVFLPNLISRQVVDEPADRIITVSRLGFVTQDQRYSVIFFDERIDVFYNSRIDDTNLPLEDFCALATDIFSAILREFPNQSNRLALNVQEIYEMESHEKMQSKGKELLKPAGYYNNRDFSEWSMRTNSQQNICISQTDETINVISELSSAVNATGKKSAILSHLDINTIPQNSRTRFDVDSLKQFVICVTTIVQSISNDIQVLISGEENG